MWDRQCERDLSGAIPDEAGLWIVPDAMSLASSIGIDREPATMATFANVKTSPHLGLNIKYGIYPLSDGAA